MHLVLVAVAVGSRSVHLASLSTPMQSVELRVSGWHWHIVTWLHNYLPVKLTWVSFATSPLSYMQTKVLAVHWCSAIKFFSGFTMSSSPNFGEYFLVKLPKNADTASQKACIEEKLL